MGAESNMRAAVREALVGLHPVSIESGAVNPGTPDLSFLGGWIEFKQVDAWPVREDTPLRVRHFTNEQRIWLRKRVQACKRWNQIGAWLLLRVGKGHDATWILLDGDVAADHLGHVPRAKLIELARWVSPRLDAAALRVALGFPCGGES